MKVLIVDDHPFIRSSVSTQLRQDRLEVVGQADNGVDAVRLVRECSPDLVVLDLVLPDMDGLQVLVRIREMPRPPKVLVLTSQLADYFSLRCMRAGASGFLSKSDNLQELSKAVRALRSGYSYFPDVSFSSVNHGDMVASEAQLIASLSDREMIILQYLARGMSNKAIGDLMLLSNKTISTYKTRLLEKLRVGSVIELADLARRNFLI
ncbi:response regulator transcription factor [Pseudomonas juntendi]|uniref:DNA-binding response regulator n=1 Tax=Pseudomonas putida TaxID=303 RepID=A0A1X1A2R1_PSEPU|nr:response regulator transcription factor [Pseudomonas putida]EKT4466817.1 response regulator transcription factor [Pseudomonas putida]MEB3899787.1 response regulator transcription factor [Pseudomonas putida]ORL66171.1 DNA-binding response regulator [Pseudomonas putida]